MPPVDGSTSTSREYEPSPCTATRRRPSALTAGCQRWAPVVTRRTEPVRASIAERSETTISPSPGRQSAKKLAA